MCTIICNRPCLLQIDKPLLLSNTNNQIDVRPTIIPIALGGDGGEADRRLLSITEGKICGLCY